MRSLSAERNAFLVRILVTISPRLYREAIALVIHRQRPDFEVLLASPDSLDGEAERFGPHALVRDDDGIEVGSPDSVVCWVGIIIDDHLEARISVDGKVSEVHEVSMDELLAVLDEAAKFVSENGIR